MLRCAILALAALSNLNLVDAAVKSVWFYALGASSIVDSDYELSVDPSDTNQDRTLQVTPVLIWLLKSNTLPNFSVDNALPSWLSFNANTFTIDAAAVKAATEQNALLLATGLSFTAQLSADSSGVGWGAPASVTAQLEFQISLKMPLVDRISQFGMGVASGSLVIVDKLATGTLGTLGANLLSGETLQFVASVAEYTLCKDSNKLCTFAKNSTLEILTGATVRIQNALLGAQLVLKQGATLIIDANAKFVGHLQNLGKIKVEKGSLQITAAADSVIGALETALDAVLELGFLSDTFDPKVGGVVNADVNNAGLLKLTTGVTTFGAKLLGQGKVQVGALAELVLRQDGLLGVDFSNDGKLRIESGIATIRAGFKQAKEATLQVLKDAHLKLEGAAQTFTEVTGALVNEGTVTIQSGLLQIKQSLNVSGSGSFVVEENGKVEIDLAQGLSFNGETVIKGGAIIKQGVVKFLKGIAFAASSTLNVAAGAVVDFANDGSNILELLGQNTVDGTLQISKGIWSLKPSFKISSTASGVLKILQSVQATLDASTTAAVAFDLKTVLEGSLEIKTGLVDFTKALAIATKGSLQIAAGAVAKVAAGVEAVWGGDGAISGAGRLQITSGILKIRESFKLSLTGALSVDEGGEISIDLAQGFKLDAGAVIDGAFRIAGGVGVIAKGFELKARASLEVVRGATLDLTAQIEQNWAVATQIINGGTIKVSAGVIKISNGITINGDGLIDIVRDAAVHFDAGVNLQINVLQSLKIAGILQIKSGIASIKNTLEALPDASISIARDATVQFEAGMKATLGSTLAILNDGILLIAQGNSDLKGLLKLRGSGSLVVEGGKIENLEMVSGKVDFQATEGVTINGKAALNATANFKKGVTTILGGLFHAGSSTFDVASGATLKLATALKNELTGSVAATIGGVVDIADGTLKIADSVTVAGEGNFTIGVNAGVDASSTGSLKFGTLTNEGTFSLGNAVSATIATFSQSGLKAITTIGGDSTGSAKLEATGTCNFLGGLLKGGGKIGCKGDIGAATVAPGHSPGTLEFIAGLKLGAASSTEIEINGKEDGKYDQIKVTGEATLAGKLTLTGGFSAQAGDKITILSSTKITGKFDSVVTSLSSGSATGKLTYTDTAVQLEVTSGTTSPTGNKPLNTASSFGPVAALIATIVAVALAAMA